MKSILAIACALALTGTSARAEETFHIVQQKPELVHIDLGTDGASHGDILAFEAGFTTEEGKTGIMSGIITTVGIPAKDGEFFDRVGNIVLDFGLENAGARFALRRLEAADRGRDLGGGSTHGGGLFCGPP